MSMCNIAMVWKEIPMGEEEQQVVLVRYSDKQCRTLPTFQDHSLVQDIKDVQSNDFIREPPGWSW